MSTVEPVYNGHPWDHAESLLYRSGLLRRLVVVFGQIFRQNLRQNRYAKAVSRMRAEYFAGREGGKREGRRKEVEIPLTVQLHSC